MALKGQGYCGLYRKIEKEERERTRERESKREIEREREGGGQAPKIYRRR